MLKAIYSVDSLAQATDKPSSMEEEDCKDIKAYFLS